jgi:putative transposase
MRCSMEEICRTLGVTRQGHYKALAVRAAEPLQIEMIVQLVAEKRRALPRLGGLKLYHLLGPDLAAMDIRLGRDRFFDALRAEHLLVKRRRKRSRTTNSFHRFRVWPNRLRDLEIERADQAWVCDITYIRLRDGFAYLFLITDVWSRKITGWALGTTLETRWSLEALAMALAGAHAPPQGGERIHHSDRGVQYCSTDYVNVLKKEAIAVSMAEAGNPYENAIAERMNGILKDEFLLDRTFADHGEAMRAVRQAVHAYNYLRPHRSIGMQIPAQRYEGERKPDPLKEAA